MAYLVGEQEHNQTKMGQDTSPRVNLDPKNSHEHSCHGLSGWGANPHALPNQRSQGTSPRVKFDALQMNSCHGLFGGRAGANHKSCPTKEAKAQAQGLILMDMHRKG